MATLSGRRPDSPVVEPPVAQPLPGPKLLALALSAGGVIVLFYAYCVLALLGIGVLMALLVVLMIGAARFGAAGQVMVPIRHLARVGSLLFKSFSLREGAAYHTLLQRDDAPRLFHMVERVAKGAGVAPPSEVVLESNLGAWVRLKGYRAGRGHTRLGLGFDLLCVFSQRELETVIAHEMAHARLVQRGFQGWLHKGALRITRLALTLRAAHANGEKGRSLPGAAVFNKVPDALRPLANRLVAAHSRQDEFAADNFAAKLCGGRACQDALLHISALVEKGADVSWRDRLVQLEREESLHQWLRAKLEPQDAEERRTLEARALEDQRRSETDTHPILSDRLAALPGSDTRLLPSPDDLDAPAIDLLDAPDAAGARLIAEVERVANEEEKRESEQMKKWLRKQGRGTKRTPWQLAAEICFYLALVTGVMLLASLCFLPSDPDAKPWAFFSACLTGFLLCVGFACKQNGVRRERSRLLPVPPIKAWQDALKARAEDVDAGIKGENARIAAQLQALLPEPLRGDALTAKRKTRRAQGDFWASQCYAALCDCDYVRAEVAARRCLETDQKRLEGLVGHGIVSAFGGDGGGVTQTLHEVVGQFGIGPSLSWAMGWAHCLLRDWGDAEIYLLDAASHRPECATLWSLLGLSQWHNGKTREAEASIRRAGSLEPHEPRHTLILAQLLVDIGRPRAALLELQSADTAQLDEWELGLVEVKAHALLGRDDQAIAQARLLESEAALPSEASESALPDEATEAQKKAAAKETRALMRLADALMESKTEALRDESRRVFERVETRGFYPSARMALARLAFDRGDKTQSRQLLLSALDITRARPDDAVHPLSLLGSVCRGLISIDEEKPERCRAWAARADLRATTAHEKDKLEAITLLVCQRDEGAAREMASVIWEAILPGRTPAPEAVTVTLEAPDEQPEEPVSPGIYGHKIE